MSWNIEYESLETFRNNEPRLKGGEFEQKEVGEQVEAARVAATALIGSNAFGHADVVVYLSGHANPLHRPAAGWTNDSVTVTIVQKST